MLLNTFARQAFTTTIKPKPSSAFRGLSFLRAFHSTRTAFNANNALTWNEFLSLRLKRRKVYVISSCFTAFGGVAAGWITIANQEIDPTQQIFGFDPFMVMAAGLIVCGAFGYLLGPSVGDIVFRRIVISKQAKQFAAKNAEFLRHIKKNRPDPSKQSYGNPVTDFYGEKIGSLKDYRQWLRDARVYKRKSEKFL